MRFLNITYLLASLLVFEATSHAAQRHCPEGADLKLEDYRPLETATYCVVTGTDTKYGPFTSYTEDHAECKGVYGRDGRVQWEKCLFQDGTKKRIVNSKYQSTYYRDGSRESFLIWPKGEKSGYYKKWDLRGKVVKSAVVEESDDLLNEYRPLVTHLSVVDDDFTLPKYVPKNVEARKSNPDERGTNSGARLK